MISLLHGCRRRGSLRWLSASRLCPSLSKMYGNVCGRGLAISAFLLGKNKGEYSRPAVYAGFDFSTVSPCSFATCFAQQMRCGPFASSSSIPPVAISKSLEGTYFPYCRNDLLGRRKVRGRAGTAPAGLAGRYVPSVPIWAGFGPAPCVSHYSTTLRSRSHGEPARGMDRSGADHHGEKSHQQRR